jgi:hypothetical protein
MPTDVDVNRELARAFWIGDAVPCPKHRGITLKGTFVATTYADHIVLDCPKGRESYTIPQRPKQQEFNPRQVEGLVVFLNRGDSVRCYRCQSPLQLDTEPDRGSGISTFTFTCVRCFSWGVWTGHPEEASIESPTVTKMA